MLHIKIICVGKLKERYFAEAAAEYAKRLGPFCRLELEELPESRLSAQPSPAEKAAAMEKEAASVALRVPAGALVAALCIEGRELSSEQLSGFLEMCALKGRSHICFVVGGSNGLDEKLKAGADLCLSMSKMTFPHHLARIMLLEQLYRAFQIREGTQYHK